MKESKIYVAGHTGLVGSALVRKLRERGYHNLLLRTQEELDLCNQSSTENFFQKEEPEYVFLAAAKVGGILANNTFKADFIIDNILIATNVIRSAYQSGVKKLLNLGSSCIYPKLAPQPLKEEYLLTGPLEATNEPYAIAKISAIKMCRYFNEQYGTNFLSLMPTNLYGPGDNFNLDTSHVLPALIRKFHLGKLLASNDFERLRKDLRQRPLGLEPYDVDLLDEEKIIALLKAHGIDSKAIELWGSGEPLREFLFVDDLADASIFVMEQFNYAEVGELVNVGWEKDISIKELAYLIKDKIGYPGEISFDRSKPDGTPKKLLDISRIKKLGWSPRTYLEEGIAKTYDWYVSTRNAKPDRFFS